MYEEFFGLTQRPFSAVPYADDFVGIPPLRDALDSLVHCVSHSRGIAVVTSGPGMGKTLLCKRMASLLDDVYRVVYLSVSSGDSRQALLQAVLFELGVDYVGLSEQEARLQLIQTARKKQAAGRGLLLIVDEAQLLSPRLFEELRTLADYAPEGKPLFQLVLCGQFELEEKLADPGLSAFNQRIGAHICLDPLSLEQSASLIIERFKACGVSDIQAILTTGALELICRASDGNLRCLGQLVDHALLLAYAEGQQQVDGRIVRAALEDLKELPLHWNEIPEPADYDLPVNLPNGIEGDPVETAPRRDDDSDPASRDTDEFPIPDFLQPRSAPSQSALSLSLAEDEAFPWNKQEPAGQIPMDPDMPTYAVIEVGAGVEDIRGTPDKTDSVITETPRETMTANASLPDPEEAIAPATFETLIPASGRAGKVEESNMVEVPVVDRYTLLDRLRELPADRRDSVDLAPLQQQQSAPQPEPVAAWIETGPGSAIVAPEPVSEMELLETVQRIRREILEQVQQSRIDVQELSSSLDTTPQNEAYDVVQPAPSVSFASSAPPPADPLENSFRPDERGTASTVSAQPQRRFEQLFTRLRLRRQKIAAERVHG